MDGLIHIPAKNFTPKRSKPIRAICIHTAECPCFAGAAKNVAAYFAGKTAPKASAHYIVDPKNVVQAVEDFDTAWHAGPTNDYSIGIEITGYAKWTKEQWLDDEDHHATLTNVAKLCADLCKKHGIEIAKLSDIDLVAGKSGFFGHDQVKSAFKSGTHWDPGPCFPWVDFLYAVRAYD